MIPGAECATCVLWNLIPKIRSAGGRLGECRARGPSLALTEDRRFMSKWPFTREDQWCGEHSTVGEPEIDPEPAQ